jgi:cutinase
VTLPRTSARAAAIAAAIGSTAATIIGGLAPTAGAEPHGQGSSCSAVEVIFARGPTEPEGIGRVGQAFVSALSAQRPDRTITTYAVNYPATYDFGAATIGASDASTRVLTQMAACPSTRFILGGFSQGAAVIDMLAGVPPLGNKVGDIGRPLPGSAVPNVAAVAVFGNPATKFGNPISSASPIFAGRAIDLCKDGDPVCSKGRNPFAHSDYVSAGLTQQAANFAAGLI